MKKIALKLKEFAIWLNASNRKKHLIGGFVVGLFGFSAFNAVYAAIVAASCLECKDRLYGNKWDWTDWTLTVTGGVLASLLYMCV